MEIHKNHCFHICLQALQKTMKPMQININENLIFVLNHLQAFLKNAQAMRRHEALVI